MLYFRAWARKRIKVSFIKESFTSMKSCNRLIKLSEMSDLKHSSSTVVNINRQRFHSKA